MNIYDKRNAFSLQQKEATVLVAFEFQNLKRVKDFRTLETDRERTFLY